MSVINGALRAIFDLVMSPFAGMSPWVTLLPVSVLVAVAMLLVFKHTSDQPAMERVKRRISAGLYELLLYNDDFRLMMRSQWEIVKANLAYIRLTLWPLLFMLPPLVLVVAQLQFFYGYEPVRPGQSVLLQVELAEDWADRGVASHPSGKPILELELPQGVVARTPGVWVESERQIDWRLGVVEPGGHEITLNLGGTSLAKSFETSEGVLRRSPLRPTSFLDQLIYPAEAPVPGDIPVTKVGLTLDDAAIGVFGIDLHWLIWFLILTIIFAFALRKPLGVVI